ncbi:iron-sulfur cluster scaffold protein nfu-related [Anaeramoeba flamelloides]|uniref:Iron-sulfur cluster scaffold protein nfu-related n=1 Tax=Anaeramoeba flamelloides TaxID=1746091 RepID=A0ABQ8X9V5_9EUKA|nr:iron-sulfur cluster scaffold protein nfu-related [Anaeramoeba flamelloides]
MSLVPFKNFSLVNSQSISFLSVGTRSCLRTFSTIQKPKTKKKSKVEEAVFDQTHKTTDNNTIKPTKEERDLEEKIQGLLKNKIAPLLRSHGGGIQYVSFNHLTGILYVKLTNACHGCPSQTMTLKHGVQKILAKIEPKIQAVELAR